MKKQDLTTYSVRISDEEKEKVQSLIEEAGITSREFFENLVGMYQLHKAKDITKTGTEDIEELQNHIKRIYEIYTNLLERNVNIQDMKEKEYTELLSKEREKTSKQEETIKDLKVKLKEQEEQSSRYFSDKWDAEKRQSEI